MAHTEPVNGTVPAVVSKAVRARPGRRNSLKQGISLQDTAFCAALVLAEELAKCSDPSVRARLGSSLASVLKAWDAAVDRVRVIRNKPLPGSLRPSGPRAGRGQRDYTTVVRSEPAETLAAEGEGEGGGK